jgi:hypothetical protein
VDLRIFCGKGSSSAGSSTATADGKPWFSNRIDPGSSTGVDGTETERGRLGRGLCVEALVHAPAPGAGDRSKSLKTACRLDAACTRAVLYGAGGGFSVNCV